MGEAGVDRWVVFGTTSPCIHMRVEDLLLLVIGQRHMVPYEEEAKAVVGCMPLYPCLRVGT